MKPIAEIFSQGEELVNGQIVDSNAAWLSLQLSQIGFQVKRHTAVGDHLHDLVELFREIAARADCCVCTGGLGPTVDDLTREAVSLACGLPLQLDEQALLQIQQYFKNRDRIMPQINRKQAYLPATAQRIDNPFGTAPGFTLQFQRCRFVFLPGVPVEMQGMFNAPLKQQLSQDFNLQPDTLVTLRSIGIGESAIQQSLSQLKLPAAVQLGFRVTGNEVQTKLLFPSSFPFREQANWVAQVADLIGDYVFAIDGLHKAQGDLIDVLDGLMQRDKHSLAILETASQGLIAAKCLAKDWLYSVDIYTDLNRLAQQWPPALDDQPTELAARHLAAQVRQQRQTDLALIQLYDGQLSDYRDKDSRIVLYNALCTPHSLISNQHKLAGNLKHKQNQAALLALDLLRRYLQNKCP